jgi:NAD(P)-dependent dehydrogenase (short-subunit alcohol dehydrogenase family)
VVLVTGCSSPAGIGFAVARGLADDGHRVFATVRDHGQDDELAAGLGDRLRILDLDLCRPETGRAALDEIFSAHGRLDLLVNNAGWGLIGGVEQVGLDDARDCFETNFFGTMDLIQAALPRLRAQGSGHIVNVSTIFAAGLAPPALGWYIATKAALETCCQALAFEVAPFGVRVTNLQPGPVDTQLSRRYGDRLGAGEDPEPGLTDGLYAWIGTPGAPALEPTSQVVDALRRLLGDDDPPLAAQTTVPGRSYVAAALVDPERRAEWTAQRAAFGR